VVDMKDFFFLSRVFRFRKISGRFKMYVQWCYSTLDLGVTLCSIDMFVVYI
jgi:hypothetical protein